MKLFIHGFWPGFIDKTNPVHIGFFQDLFQAVFNCEIELSTSIQDSDILLESIFSYDTQLFKKQWTYSFLFSGESRLNQHASKYTCILWGERNHESRINIPLFVPYLYCNDFLQTMQNPTPTTNIPPKNICAIITNPRGHARNQFLDALEKHIPIDYAGKYKNNVPIITHDYNTKEFRDAISQYKFIVSMENSKEDTYITEKITHGLLANIIPIYWGSDQVEQYFNPARFINVKCSDNKSLEQIIDNIVNICKTPDTYTKMVNQPNFNNDNKLDRTIENISRDIRNHIFPRLYPSINQIYIMSSPEFEPERYARLCTLFYDTLQISKDNIKFMKNPELSLFYNYKAVLEDITANYKDGQFLIFESDVYATENISDLNTFLEFVATKHKMWDLIHIGSGNDPIYMEPFSNINTNYTEDITIPTDTTRLIRKHYTRGTDSFIWNYNGVQTFVNGIKIDTNYGDPLDHYMLNFFETNTNFKHYCTTKPFFLQGSNCGLEPSTI